MSRVAGPPEPAAEPRPAGLPAPTAGKAFAALAAALAAFFYSWSAVFTRVYESAGGEAMALVLFRMQLAVIAFGAAALARRSPWPRPRDALLGIGLGAFQLLYNSALLLGFARASASLVVLLFYVYPILVVIGASVLFDERVGRQRALLIVLGMSGLILIVGAPGTVTAVGVGFGLTAGVGNSITILGIRYLLGRGLEVPQVLALSYLLPASITLVLLGSGSISLPPATASALLPAIGFATVGSIVPLALFYGAVARIGAGNASLFATLDPLLTVLWAFALLGESLTAMQLVGGAMIIMAVTGLSLSLAKAIGPPPPRR